MDQVRLHAAVHHRSLKGDAVGPHQHQQHELVLILAGELTVACAGGPLDGQPGRIHLFPAGCRHDQGCRGPWHTLCLLFEGGSPLAAGGARALDGGDDRMVLTWAEHLVPLAQDGGDAARATADALLAAILARVGGLEHERADRDGMHPALAATCERIRARLDRDLDVGRLAGESGLSQSHLGALFRDRFGCSMLQWHQRLRLERAQALLANPYASVADVARELGFADANYFVRRFRAALGRPPGRWRRTAADG